MVIKISHSNIVTFQNPQHHLETKDDAVLPPAFDKKKWHQLKQGALKKELPPKIIGTKKTTVKPYSWNHLKLNFKTTRVMGLLTNSVYELQAAIKDDYENKIFYQTPRTVLGETMGWASSAVGGALAFAFSGNAKIAEFAGMGAYAMGREIGQNAIDDQKYFWTKNLDYQNNSFENKLDRVLQGINIAALGPIAGVYAFARLTKE